MIQVIPVIYLFNDEAVILTKGNISRPVPLNTDAKTLAQKFFDHGMNQLFLIDIGGLGGFPKNWKRLEEIATITGLEITYGGGISNEKDVQAAFDHGASKVTASSIAVNQSDVFSSWLISYGRRKLVLSADVMGSKVARLGETSPSEKEILDFVEYFYLRGILYVKSADISLFKEKPGPAFDLYAMLKRKFPDIEIIAGGGIHSIKDIHKLHEVGVSSALVGKAFYDEKISLKSIVNLMVEDGV